MPTEKYYLTEEKTDYIFMEWSGAYKDMSIKFNDRVIGHIDGQKELKKGKKFEIDENRKVLVKFSDPLFPQLGVSINGAPLPGSPMDPNEIISRVSFTIYLIGGLNVVVGLVTELMGEPIKQHVPGSYINVLTGVMLLVLGSLIKKKNLNALIITILFSLIDVVFLFVDAQSNPAMAFIIRVGISAYLIINYKALKRNSEFS